MGIVHTIRSVVQFKPIEVSPVRRRLNRAANIDDLRVQAKRRLPRGVFDYIDGAAEDEQAVHRNRADFAHIEIKPLVLRDVSHIDTTATVLGAPTPIPLVLSPTGFTRIAHSQGELAVARPAERFGLPYTLSTMGTRSIDEVADVSGGRKWFQVYTWRDRGLVVDMLARAATAGYEAAMLTVDTAVLGRRERDVRRGYSLPPKIGFDTIIDGILHPGWTLDFLQNPPITFANVASNNQASDGSTAVELATFINSQFDPTLSWDDIEWLRSHWPHKIIVKGVQTVADAERAAVHGVDAIALSNHGGRQLDSAPSPISLVAPVVDAVAGRAEVYCDGGVRRGSDIFKALALGADACMIGRPYLYGLGAAGERGVDHVLQFLADGLAQTMALSGCQHLGDITRDMVRWRQ